MSIYIPIAGDLLSEIAEAGGFDAVYDVTATSEPKQEDTVVLLAVKVLGGNAVEESKRFFVGSFGPGDTAMVVAPLLLGVMESVARAGIE